VAFPDNTTPHNASRRFSARSGGKTLTQHALFLQYVSGMAFVNHEPTASSDPSVNTQAEFDYFYSCSLALLNKFYPEKTVTLTRDHVIIPASIQK